MSSPFWDLVFGTYLPVAQVTVPRLHAHKFPWLFEGETIAARWQSHYRVV